MEGLFLSEFRTVTLSSFLDRLSVSIQKTEPHRISKNFDSLFSLFNLGFRRAVRRKHDGCIRFAWECRRRESPISQNGAVRPLDTSCFKIHMVASKFGDLNPKFPPPPGESLGLF